MARPKGFERNTVLEQAMDLFWDRGYNATSIQDLEAALQINRTSLYREFGSKHALFLAVLDQYRDEWITRSLSTLVSSSEGLASIQQFFTSTVDTLEASDWRSCLMSNSAAELSIHDPLTAVRTKAHMAQVAAAFRAALQRAVAQGELSQDAQLDDLACYLTTIQHGLGVMGKATGDRRTLEKTVDSAMKFLSA